MNHIEIIIKYACRSTLVALKQGLLTAAMTEDKDNGNSSARRALQDAFAKVATEILRIDEMNEREV